MPCLKQRKTHAVHKTVIMNMSEDLGREDDLQFFAQPYLLKQEYTDNELRTLTWKRRNC